MTRPAPLLVRQLTHFPPRLVWATFGRSDPPALFNYGTKDTQFLVLCLRCTYTSGDGMLTCDVIHQRLFPALSPASAYGWEASYSAEVFGREPRAPDVTCIFEVVAVSADVLEEALYRVRRHWELRSLLKTASERWIDMTNPYRTTLAQARADPSIDVIAMLEGDCGGQTYVVCPVRLIRCDESTLRRLLVDIDAHQWREPQNTRMSFFRTAIGSRVGGGMGGGNVVDGVWIHERLRQLGLAPFIELVLIGDRPTLD